MQKNDTGKGKISIRKFLSRLFLGYYVIILIGILCIALLFAIMILI